jgi:hypothetical protein
VPEWLAVTGAISVVAVAAGIVSGPSLASNPVALSVPNAPVTLDFAPPSASAVATLPPVPASIPPVPLPSLVPVSPPALPTAPVRHAPVTPNPLDTLVPTTMEPEPSTVPSDTVPPTTTENPCPVGLVLDPVLGVCVSI